MSDHLYERKMHNGRPAKGTDGNPSLDQLIVAAFPNTGFTIRCVNDDLTISVERDLTEDEITALDVLYESWNPVDLDGYKAAANLKLDTETESRIKNGRGFEWPPNSGQFFSLTSNAQVKWLGMLAFKDFYDYQGDPPEVRTKNDLVRYIFSSPDDVAGAVATAMITIKMALGHSSATKGAVLACETIAEVDTIVLAYFAEED